MKVILQSCDRRDTCFIVNPTQQCRNRVLFRVETNSNALEEAVDGGKYNKFTSKRIHCGFTGFGEVQEKQKHGTVTQNAQLRAKPAEIKQLKRSGCSCD